MTSQKELIPMKPGDILRYERKQKGLSLERASDQSRIKYSTLAAIESGETGEIPSVYLRGYIRNYAHFLGLDPSELDDHMDHVQGAEPEVVSVFTVKSNRGSTEKWLKVSSYLAASALIATLAWQFTHEAVRFSQGDPQLTTATESGQDSSGEAMSGTVMESRSANTHLNASIAPVEMLKQRGELSGKSAAEQAWAAIGGEPVSAQAANGIHELAVTTSADTWVEILDKQGAYLEMDLIRAGSIREYRGEGPFQVMIGRASAVELSMDGAIVNLGPYTRGNVARMTLGASAPVSSDEPVETVIGEQGNN